MNRINQEVLWGMLLQLRNKIRSHPNGLINASILWFGPHFEVYLNKIPEFTTDVKAIIFSRDPILEFPGIVSFLLDENYGIKLLHNLLLTPSQIDFLQLYLPMCFAAPRAHQKKRSMSVLHMAQSLDGRIATDNGQSKWIGNQENLVHIDRLLALSDAVLIGARTLEIDKPTLHVHYVKGANPVKVVLGNNSYDFSSLLSHQGKVMLVTSRDDLLPEGVETVFVPSQKQIISSQRVLEELYERNIYSIFIQGGSKTASEFMVGQSVDFFQLFMSPRIFGSGVSGFNLPAITDIEDSIELVNSSFKPMGDGILIEGEVSYQKTKHDYSGIVAYQQQ